MILRISLNFLNMNHSSVKQLNNILFYIVVLRVRNGICKCLSLPSSLLSTHPNGFCWMREFYVLNTGPKFYRHFLCQRASEIYILIPSEKAWGSESAKCHLNNMSKELCSQQAAERASALMNAEDPHSFPPSALLYSIGVTPRPESPLGQAGRQQALVVHASSLRSSQRVRKAACCGSQERKQILRAASKALFCLNDPSCNLSPFVN